MRSCNTYDGVGWTGEFYVGYCGEIYYGDPVKEGGVLGVSMYVGRGEWRCIQGVSGRYKENRRLGRH